MNHEIKEWLSRFLGSSEISKLQQISVRVSASREIDLCDLVAGWYQHLKKMESDLPLSDSDRTVWGAYDLLAALSLRDFVARGLGKLDPDCSTAAAAAVRDVDEKFLSYTEQDDCQRIKKLDDSIGEGRGWWWKRIPVSGPIRREIDAISARMAD
ncbi:hypothetical protein [Streptomyces sp. XD-27]|uniref:hypothetical protein n=1 Tax=Streptomyces sp. XD-27 TaxID=3062779 RepID=UPI0026F4668B|nr:hypothetical protein [Streptomyces sp. XD-27]WKX73554.1 hypothetical protein Q3Y56_29950 [Streptomyces sp. XD-27]